MNINYALWAFWDVLHIKCSFLPWGAGPPTQLSTLLTQRNAHTALITSSLLISSYRKGSWYKIVKYIEFWVLENIDKREKKWMCNLSVFWYFPCYQKGMALTKTPTWVGDRERCADNMTIPMARCHKRDPPLWSAVVPCYGYITL